MKHMHFKKVHSTNRWSAVVLTLLMFCLLPFEASAKGIPKGYPPSFDHNGVVGKIDLDGGFIVIQDTQFILPTNLNVVTPRGKKHSTHAIQIGQRVGVNLNRNQSRDPVITGLWILPKSHPGLAAPY